MVEKIDAITYHVIATTSIADINDHLPYAIEVIGDATTLAGILIHKFGRIPAMNEKIRLDEYEVTVLKKIRNTINLVQLKDLAK